MEKYQIKVNDTIINADHLSYEYAQQDSEASGRSEDLTMYREVLGLINKLYVGLEPRTGKTLTDILYIVKHVKEASVTYIDPEAGQVTKNMYVSSDKVEIELINNEFWNKPFEIRFTQMDSDEV